MLKFLMPFAAGAALLAGAALPAVAADLYEPPIVEAPPVVYQQPSVGGWYIRGDIDYHQSRIKEIEYITYGAEIDCCTGEAVAIPGTDSFNSSNLRAAMSLGAGIGYQVNSYFRTDLTADYWFKAKFNGSTPGQTVDSTDTSAYQALLLLANAYVDLGTYHRITPYVGAGIGGAYVRWDELRNQYTTPDVDVDDRHPGAKGMRFAWAVMAGASYCLTNNLSADVGYRFSQISGGRMFDYVDSSAGGPGAGPGFHSAINTHEVRGGLRYSFGGNNCVPQEVAYEPDPIVPIYK